MEIKSKGCSVNTNRFSVINPKVNKTYYYIKNFFSFNDISSTNSNYQFLINQEKKFIQLIFDAEIKERFFAWLKYIYI